MRNWVTAVVAFVLGGCSLPGKGGGEALAKSGTDTMVTPGVLRLEGRVVRTNVRLNFVVLDFGLTGLPAIGRQFAIYRLGQRVGLVRVSGPAWDTYTVADIIDGEIWKGDEALTK
ncbi:MAG TPA: hypothetical protein DCO70_03530 [Verrucomicrobiales bacterium]|nr:hypothetical protein [Verrucomicrobiota bacterium]HAH98378.1 hypothetical protein [Verrucomicrobiales bacterium]